MILWRNLLVKRKKKEAEKKEKSNRNSAFHEEKHASPTSRISGDKYDEGEIQVTKKKKSEKPEKKVDDVDEFARSFAGWADVEKEKAAFEIQKEREIHELQMQQKRIEIEVQTQYLLLMKRSNSDSK